MTDWTQDEKYCYAALCQIRQEMGLQSTSERRFEAIKRTLGLMIMHGPEKVSDKARATMSELALRLALTRSAF